MVSSFFSPHQRHLEGFPYINFYVLLFLLPHSQLPVRNSIVSPLVWVITFDLSDKGGLASSYAVVDIALRDL
jgi:hypothetical protein